MADPRVRADRRQPRLGRGRAAPTAGACGRRPTSTPTCSGRCAAVAGNFGVVTEFEFRLHPVGPDRAPRAAVLGARPRRARRCGWRGTSSTRLPRDAGGMIVALNAPPAPFVRRAAPLRAGRRLARGRLRLREAHAGARRAGARRAAAAVRVRHASCPTPRCSRCSTRARRGACTPTARRSTSTSSPTRPIDVVVAEQLPGKTLADEPAADLPARRRVRRRRRGRHRLRRAALGRGSRSTWTPSPRTPADPGRGPGVGPVAVGGAAPVRVQRRAATSTS